MPELNNEDIVDIFAKPVEKKKKPIRKVITFDLYGGLLNYRLIPHFVGQIARENGLSPEVAENLFRIYLERIKYGKRYTMYSEVLAEVMQYLDMELNSKAFSAAIKELYIIHYDLKPYSDVLPALRKLQSDGYEMYVLCNSSVSVCRGMVAKFEGILKDRHFIFSDNLKAYKPSRDFFKGAADRIKLNEADEHYHISSNYFSDIEGAISMKWNAIYLNRAKTGINQSLVPKGVITDLSQVPECIARIKHDKEEERKARLEREEAERKAQEAAQNPQLAAAQEEKANHDEKRGTVGAAVETVIQVAKDVVQDTVQAVSNVITVGSGPSEPFVPKTEEDKELAKKLATMSPARARAVLKAREKAMALAKARSLAQ